MITINIRLKLTIGFLLVSLYVGFVGFQSVTSFNDIENKFTEYNQHTVSQIELFSSIKDYMHMALINVNSYLITGNEMYKQRALNHLAKLEEAEEGYEDLVKGEFAEEIKNTNDQSRTKIIELIELYETNMPEETVRQKVSELAMTRMETMKFYHDAIDTHFEEERKEVSEIIIDTFNTNLDMIVATTVVSLILALSLGLYISGSISRSIISLKESVNKVARGNLRHKIKIESRDEIGDLASDFDIMTNNLRIRTNSLKEANKKVKGLMEARTEFIHRSAHDLRTPITPILALIPIIKKQLKNKRILYDIGVIERNANYLKGIVNNLMSYLKSRTGKYNYAFKKTNIRKIIEEVLMSYEKVLNQHRITVVKKIPKNLPLIELDVLKITEVVQNLASNALKFTSKGGELVISAEKLDNFINIKFKDTGIGMTKKTLSKIFIEFYKEDEARHAAGQGLGLSICKEIIEDHHGKIWAESEGPGKGSTILFNIPITQKR